MRPFFIACSAVGLLGCTAMAAKHGSSADVTSQPGGRLRPSPELSCNRDNLTSYSGVVSGYRPKADSTWIEISTDDDTVESVSVDHAGQSDGSARYQLWGARFSAGDKGKIEKSPGVLVPGMRAVAWVCDDGKTAPVIDWQPRRG